jgi:hypothetical protein
VTPTASDAEILLHIATFQEALVAGDVDVIGPGSLVSSQPTGPTPTSLFQPDRPAPTVAHPLQVSRPHFLEITDVRDVMDAASVLIQEEGRTFNLSAEVRFIPLREETEGESVLRAERWMARLMEWRDADGKQPASVWSITRDGAVFVLLIAAELNSLRGDRNAQQRGLTELETWMAPLGSDARATVALHFKMSPGGTNLQRTRFHWKAARRILRSIEPDLLGFDDAAQQWLPLYDLIGLKKSELRPTGPVRGKPVRFGGRLNPEELEPAARNGMGFISAFRDRRWDVLTRVEAAWEFSEHEERLELRQRDHGDNAGARPIEPRDRPRSFLAWWQR